MKDCVVYIEAFKYWQRKIQW